MAQDATLLQDSFYSDKIIPLKNIVKRYAVSFSPLCSPEKYHTLYMSDTCHASAAAIGTLLQTRSMFACDPTILLKR